MSVQKGSIRRAENYRAQVRADARKTGIGDDDCQAALAYGKQHG